MCSRPVFKTIDSKDYVEKLLAEKPEIIQNNDFVENIYTEIKNDKSERKTVKVV